MQPRHPNDYLSDTLIESTNRIIDAVFRYPAQAGTLNVNQCLFIRELPEV